MLIEPRPIGQTLTDATNTLARVWKALLPPAVLASIPVGVLTIVAFSTVGGDEMMQLALNDPDAFDTMTENQLLDLLIPFYVSVGIALVLQVILSVFLHLVAARAVVLDLAGHEVSVGSVTSALTRRLLRGLAAALVIGVGLLILFVLGFFIWSVPFVSVGTPNSEAVLVATLLFFLLLAPGVWTAVSVSMTVSTIGVEQLGVMASIQRSMRLVRRRWWATALYLIVVGLLGGIAVQLIQLIAFPFAASGSGGGVIVVGALLGILAQGLIIVLIGVAYAHWYVDLRARRAPLTTEALTSVDPAPPPPPPAQPLS